MRFGNAIFAAPFVIGTWFGTGQPDNKAEMWVARMGADGVFQAQFRVCVKGQPLDEFETGRWQLAGDSETIHVRTVNGAPIVQDDLYKILFHDGQKQVYRYLPDGFVFTSHRVQDGFEMPSCEAIS